MAVSVPRWSIVQSTHDIFSNVVTARNSNDMYVTRAQLSLGRPTIGPICISVRYSEAEVRLATTG